MHNICHVIVRLNPGGAELVLKGIIEFHIARQSHRHTVVSLTSIGEIGRHLQSKGVEVYALGMRSLADLPAALWRLTRLVKSIKPDLVQTWMYHADLVGGVAAKLAGSHTIVWGIRHSNLSPALNKRTTLAVVRACVAVSGWVPHRILTCSEAARQVHIQAGYPAAKLSVIPNGFDLSRFKPDHAARLAVRRELGVGSDTPLVGLVGRFDPQKNHAGFFVAAAHVARRDGSVHFVLAGSSIDTGNQTLMNAIDAAGVRHLTHLLGPRNDIPRLVAALDVMASSSAGEAFANVLGEAMACAVPCAVTDVGDSALIVGDTGKVVPAGDMAGLARAIRDLLEMPAGDRAEIGARARDRISEHFEIGQIVTRYEAFYDDVVSCAQRRKRDS